MGRKKKNQISHDTLTEIKEIIREWDLRLGRIKESSEGFQLKTPAGMRVLRRSLFEDRILFMHQVLEHMAGRGYKENCSRLIPTKYGDPYVSYGFHVYYLTDSCDRLKFKTDHPEHVISAGRCLGEIHQAGRGFIAGDEGAARERWNALQTKIESNLDTVQNRLPALPAAYNKAWALLVSDGEKAAERLKRPFFGKLIEKAQRERTICHGRFIPGHLMHGEKTIAGHWEHTALGLQAADLITFLHKVLPEHRWDFALAEAFFNAYRENCPLTSEDMVVIGAGLTFPMGFCRLIKKIGGTGRDERRDLKELDEILAGEKRRVSFLEDFSRHYDMECGC